MRINAIERAITTSGSDQSTGLTLRIFSNPRRPISRKGLYQPRAIAPWLEDAMKLADTREFFWVKAGATDKGSINIRLAHDVDDIG